MFSIFFVLNAESCARVHDVLTCLAKFGEALTIEAGPNQLSFTALNSSKSAYASIVFDRNEFFTRYDFARDEGEREDRFACSIMNKALMSVFRAKMADSRVGEAAIDRCEVSVQDRNDQTKCRFNIKIICRHGVTKTYKLTYESVDMMHALFDRNRAVNRWKVSSRILREYIDFFGPRTEHLDFFADNDRFTLTSYTEKITNGQQILKQPLQTAVTVDSHDFEEFSVQDNLHVAISVKDFRSVVMHAETLRTNVTALYSQPSKPLQFSYASHGIQCEFTLMTIGDPRTAPAPAAQKALPREQAVSSVGTRSEPFRARTTTNMHPPALPASRSSRGSLEQLGSRNASSTLQPQNQANADSLFVAQEDDEAQWEPTNYRDEDEDMLGWDASADNETSSHATFRDSNPRAESRIRRDMQIGGLESGVAPTQRVSQIRGLFD